MMRQIAMYLSIMTLLIACVGTPEKNKTGVSESRQDEIVFNDSKLEMAVREAVGKPSGSLSPSDVIKLNSLNASNLYISELSGIEQLQSLTSLDLSHDPEKSEGGGITNLEPLAKSTLLRELRLGNNKIHDISPLASLTSLQVLELSNNQIVDISPLASLVSLKSLSISNNRISNILPLRSLSSLNLVDLSYNEIRDINPLADLPSLRMLNLKANDIQDISALQYLTPLNTLDLSENRNIREISALIDLPALEQLWIGGARLNDNALNIHIPYMNKSGIDIYLPITELVPSLRKCRIVHEREGNLVISDCVGTEVLLLTDHDAADKNPTWSPDGKHIVFQSNRDNQSMNSIYIVDTDGVDLSRLTFEDDSQSPAWSPDGAKIAFTSNCDIALMNPDGTDVTIVVSASDEICGGSPVWSPESQRLAFISQQRSAASESKLTDIYIVMRDGTDLRKLASIRSRYITLVWTPNGQQLGVRVSEPNESIEYFLVDANNPDMLTKTFPFPMSWYQDYWPRWLQ